MASTSEQLASAVTAINTLQQTYAQEVGKWQTERTTMAALLANAVAAVPNLRKIYYVDSVNGNDGNEGTSAKPLATLDKALALTALMYAGRIEIVLRPGIYDVNVARSYSNIFLVIAGSTPANVNDIIVNWRSSAHEVQNAVFNIRYCTLNRVAPETAVQHNRAVVKFMFGSGIFGTYAVGAISATNRALHFISDGCPLFSSENSGGFMSMEFVYAENTQPSPATLVQTRGMMLLYKTVNSILSNFTTPPTELKYVRVSE